MKSKPSVFGSSVTRRGLLQSGGAMAAAATLGLWPRAARAMEGGERKFVFVFAQGGWDPTRVFASEFSNRSVAMEADAERATAGGVTYVDHPMRPSVRAFFERWHRQSLVFNGLMVRSIAHEICTQIAMTGTTGVDAPDWPATIAAAARDRFTLPHLVLGGPSFTGELGVAVARTGFNGQLDGLISGDVLGWSDQAVRAPVRPAESLMDRYLERRAAAFAMGGRPGRAGALASDFSGAIDHTAQLKDLQWIMQFSSQGDVASQVPVAVEALSLGISRTVMIGASGGVNGWDTHANNDALQSPLWEDLFYALLQLVEQLSVTPGDTEASLLDETTIVVLSEMGRTPLLNGFNGKDHWPFTSALLIGSGVAGDRVIGGFDDNYYGHLIDPASGDTTDSGETLSSEALGATLLALADIDPGPYVSGVSPIEGALS